MNQLTLFNLDNYTNYNPATEPPDPDDYFNQEQYDAAWADWEKKYPELVADAVAMSPPCESVGEQVTLTTKKRANTNNLVKFPTKKSAPQHDNHWVEKYWVERSGNKYWYWRYMWMEGRKLHRRYIGSITSPKARDRKLAIEEAINFGRSPKEIEKLIKQWRDVHSVKHSQQ
ncbi:hypothetical protein BCD64_23305 [Nostoc sp. MBR 210]|nr:hypothetical protein BCD64_23305 [Nostoc sp. MBR 210]